MRSDVLALNKYQFMTGILVGWFMDALQKNIQKLEMSSYHIFSLIRYVQFYIISLIQIFKKGINEKNISAHIQNIWSAFCVTHTVSKNS
jgi:hypothetical protein